jgi:hypothetical protein
MFQLIHDWFYGPIIKMKLCVNASGYREILQFRESCVRESGFTQISVHSDTSVPEGILISTVTYRGSWIWPATEQILTHRIGDAP